MSNDFERTTRIINGYWCTFEYHNQKETVPGYDRFPMIYCIGPSTKNLNCFEALNLHHLPLEVRIEFMCRLHKGIIEMRSFALLYTKKESAVTRSQINNAILND